MKTLVLTRGYTTKVDDEDFERLSQFDWTAHVNKDGSVYGRRRLTIGGVRLTIHLHRFIMDTPDDMVVDHIDGDPLNNQKSNLRNCSSSQNNANRGTHGKTGLKGVYIIAAITIDGKNKHLGTFATVEEAAAAYDKAAISQFGEFANLNFKH